MSMQCFRNGDVDGNATCFRNLGFDVNAMFQEWVYDVNATYFRDGDLISRQIVTGMRDLMSL